MSTPTQYYGQNNTYPANNAILEHGQHQSQRHKHQHVPQPRIQTTTPLHHSPTFARFEKKTLSVDKNLKETRWNIPGRVVPTKNNVHGRLCLATNNNSTHQRLPQHIFNNLLTLLRASSSPCSVPNTTHHPTSLALGNRGDQSIPLPPGVASTEIRTLASQSPPVTSSC